MNMHYLFSLTFLLVCTSCSFFDDAENTIIVLPGTQKYTYPETQDVFQKQMEWIVMNKGRDEIGMVVHTGSIVDFNDTQSMWDIASDKIKILEDNKIPYMLSLGHNDYTMGNPPSTSKLIRTSSKFSNTFPYYRVFANKKNQVGTYKDSQKDKLEDRMDNSYRTQKIQGKNVLFLSIEMFPRISVINWVDHIIRKHKDHVIFITTNAFIDKSGELISSINLIDEHNANLDAIAPADWIDRLTKHPNLIVIACSQSTQDKTATGPGVVSKRIDVGTFGNKIITIMTNYQMAKPTDPGYGALRIIHVTPNWEQFEIKTYSSVHGRFLTDSENQFTLDLVQLN